MNVIVVGCGRIGAELANSLYRGGHLVSVIDDNKLSFNNLPADFKGVQLEGDALNHDLLIRAGIETCDGLAAVTNNDPLNVVVAHMAKTEFHVPNVVARNYDPHIRSLFEVFNIQVVSSTSWGAQRIEELLSSSEFRTVYSVGNGEVEIYELLIPSDWDGKTVGELITCAGCKWLAITRAGRAMLPETDTVLKTGDVLAVAATMDGIVMTRKNLENQKEN